MTEKKEAIIKACIHLINEKGLELSSMANIAKEVGISKSTLYFHFESKEQLLSEVFLYCHKLDYDSCNVGLENIENSIDKLLKRFDNMMNYALTHKEEAGIERIFGVSPNYRELSQEANNEFFNVIESIIDEGINNNEIKKSSSIILTHSYYGIMSSLYLHFVDDPNDWDKEDVRESCYEVIRSLLKK